MTKIHNISVTLPSQFENLLLNWVKLKDGKDKETFLKEELERMLIDKIVEELEDYNSAIEAHHDFISSWWETISFKEIEEKYNLK